MRNFFFFFIVFLAFCGYASLGLSNPSGSDASNAPEMERVENSMVQVNKQILAIRRDVGNSTGKIQKDLELKLRKLEEAQDDLEDRVTKLRKSSGKAWTEVEKGFTDSLFRLRDSIAKVQKELKSN